jgi:WD40 repeat protein
MHTPSRSSRPVGLPGNADAPTISPTQAALTSQGPAPAAQSVVVAGYEVIGELGKGGMGVVYKARQVALDRVVALKMILHAEHAGAEERERFRTEAQAVARLQHSNIVQVHEVGECQGLPYFSLEFCPGGSLADRLDGTPWEARAAAQLVEVLARAIHVAHEAHIVHRDLKPANVLLTADGQPKISDFGLAKKLGEQGRTATGAVLGTPSYMAPEQAGNTRNIGPAADVYALGAILYELLTGRPPFKAATQLDTVLLVISEEPVAVRRLQPGVPRDLETVCHRCLEKDTNKRYASARELAADLGRFLAGEPVLARPVGALGRVAKWARRRPAVAALVFLVIAVTAAGLGGILWAYGEARREAEAARQQKERADQKAEEAALHAEDARKQAQRADRSAEEALQKKAEAEKNEQEARRQTYLATIGRIESLIHAKDLAGASRVLDTLEGPRRWEHGLLRRQAEGTPLTLRGHTAEVSGVAFSPDGTQIVSGSRDGTLKLWDANTGQEIRTLRGHSSQVTSVAFSGDGKRIVSSAWGGPLRVWDATSGRLIVPLRGHTSGVNSVAFSPDGTRIASGSADNTMKVWNAKSGAELFTLRGHTAPVTSVAFSPNGAWIVSGSEDETVKLWDANRGCESQRGFVLRGSGPVLAVAFSPDGRLIASGSRYHNVRVWDAESGRQIIDTYRHSDEVMAVAFCPDGTRIATCSQDNTVKLCSARSGDEISTFRGHAGVVTSIAFSPDGLRIATGSADKTAKIWDVRSEGAVATFHDKRDEWFASVALSPDGLRIASGSSNATVKVWDARSRRQITTLRGHSGFVHSVAFSPDGTRLASSWGDYTVTIWDADSWRAIFTLRDAGTRVAFSADGKFIATTGLPEGGLKVWDAHSGATVATLRGHTREAVSIAFSRDGARLATGSLDNTAKVWDARSGREITTLRGHAGLIISVAFSPDGRRVVTGSWDNTAKVWDSATGGEIATLRGHNSKVNSVAFSPDGKRIATGSWDTTAKVWDAETYWELTTLRGHTQPVAAVAFSGDAMRIVSASGDGTVKVWDARSTGEITTLRGHTTPVASVVFNANGTRILSKDVGGKTLVWDAATGKLCVGEWQLWFPHYTNSSPDGQFVAVPDGELIRVCRRRPLPGEYDPWAEDLYRRQAMAASWHTEDAEQADQRCDAFAALFHRRVLALRPGGTLEQLRLARTCFRFGRWGEALSICTRLLVAALRPPKS